MSDETTETTESPWIENYADGTVGVTIKYGRGYEETWANFKGIVKVVRQTIIDYFGLTAEETEGLSLHEVVINATKLAHSVSAASAGLGGTVISQGGRSGGGWSKAAENAAPAAPERNPLYGKVEEVADVTALRELFARNKAAFEADAELLQAWKDKGKALTVAAAT